jgi:hypothetical protein
MNNKMKKFNKILMMTVAILLTLVLASTSVVSGIFAKYVVTKTAQTTVSLKKFGLTLTLEGTAKDNVTVVTSKPSGTSLEIKADVTLAPGETADNAFKIKIGTVDANTKSSVDAVIKVNVVATMANFNVPKDISGLNAAKNFVPISITAKTLNNTSTVKSGTVFAAWSSPADNTALQTAIASGLKSNLGFTDGSAANEKKLSVCSKNSNPSITEVDFSFACPKSETATDLGTLTKTDEVQTYLGTQANLPTMSFTFTVSLEQA